MVPARRDHRTAAAGMAQAGGTINYRLAINDVVASDHVKARWAAPSRSPVRSTYSLLAFGLGAVALRKRRR